MEKNDRKPASAKAEEEYLLTTKLFCGDCERMMIGKSDKSHTGRIYYYYKCGGANSRSGCKRKAIKKDWIERAAVVLTVSRVLQDEEIDRITDKLVALQEREDTAFPALQQQLEKTEKFIDNLLTAIQQGILTKSTKKRMDDLEAQKEELEISILQDEMKKPQYTKEQVVAWMDQPVQIRRCEQKGISEIDDRYFLQLHLCERRQAYYYLQLSRRNADNQPCRN